VNVAKPIMPSIDELVEATILYRYYA